MTEIKNDETITSVNGGTDRKAALKAELAKIIGPEVMKKLDGVLSNVEVSKILAENGVDLDKIEQTIKNAGLDMNRIGLQLPEDDLNKISGGFYDDDLDDDFDCLNCGNDDRKEFSRQFWASLTTNAKSIYRCKKCGMYTAVMGKNAMTYSDFDLDTLKDYIKKHS